MKRNFISPITAICEVEMTQTIMIVSKQGNQADSGSGNDLFAPSRSKLPL